MDGRPERPAGAATHLLRIGLAIAAAISVAGCSNSDQSRGGPSVDVRLYAWLPGEDSMSRLEDELDSYPGATSLTAQLTQPLRHRIRSGPTTQPITSERLELPALPFGEDVRLDFSIIGREEGAETASRLAFGASPLFDTSKSSRDRFFRVQLTEVESFAPVGAWFEGDGEYRRVEFDPRAVQGKHLGRTGHDAVRTSSGAVLVVGGAVTDQPATPSEWPGIRALHDDLQRFVPRSGHVTDLSFDATTGQPRPQDRDRLAVGRAYHTVTPVGDDRYLVAGGWTGTGAETEPTRSLELIDLNATPGERVRHLKDGSGERLRLNEGRAFHTATYRSSSDHVVVAGGFGEEGEVLDSVELVDLEQEEVRSGFSMNAARAKHEAVRMGGANEAVWMLGGIEADGDGVEASTELVVPREGEVTAIEKAPLRPPRYSLAAVRTDEKVIAVCGGYTATDGEGAPTDRCQLGGTDRAEWRAAWTMRRSRGNLEMVALTQSADLVVLGGRDSQGDNVAAATILVSRGEDADVPYAAESGGKGEEGARYGATVTRLNNGMVLLTGGAPAGSGGMAPFASLAYYNPADVVGASSSDVED